MGRRLWSACLVGLCLSGCATKPADERTASSQPVRLASATFYCSHKLPEGAQLARECVFKDKLDDAYEELAELYALYQGYEQSKK